MSALVPISPVSGNTQLVPVYQGTIGGVQAHVVIARELHTFLEAQTRFNDWIASRIEKYGFVENQDFASFTQKTVKPSGGRPSTEYHLTLDMAKELSMVENNAKGRDARRYFISMEKQALALTPQDLPTALRLYADKLEQNAKQQLVIQQQAQEINAARPKVEFHDQIVMADKTYTFTEVFGLLKHYTGQTFNGASFLQFLREQGIACKPNPHSGIGQRAFAPRQHYIGSWFVSQLTPAGDVEWLMRPLAVSALIELIMNAPEFEEVNKQLTAPTSH